MRHLIRVTLATPFLIRPAAAIQSYLSGNQKGYLTLNYQSSSAIGISVTNGSTSAVQATNAKVVIGRDSSMPDGYKIITGYPTS